MPSLGESETESEIVASITMGSTTSGSKATISFISIPTTTTIHSE